MMRFTGYRARAGLLGAALLLLAPSAFAADWGIAARAGSLGLGVDLARSMTPFFNARIGVSAYDYDFDFESDDVDYDGELQLESAHALLDFHPFTGGFRITGGLVGNGNQVIASGESSSFPGQRVDTKVDFDSTAPYVGIGWGNVTSGILPISWTIDVGLMSQGSPNVEVDSTLGSAYDQQEEEDIEDELEDFDTYPVINAGLVFRF